jgi:hypothetical protein
MPSAPPIGEEAVAPVAVERPRSVSTAFLLWLVIGLFLLVSLVLFITVSSASLEDLVSSAANTQGQSLSPQEVKDAAAGYRGLGIGINLILTLLVISFAFVMRSGKNWARVTLCVAGGIVVVIGLFGFSASILLTLLDLAAGVIAVVFMFRRDSNRYFAAGKVRR